MMTLEEIEKEFMLQQITPSRIAKIKVILAGKYARVMNELEQILLQKPIIWNKMRPDYKSDAATERAWEASDLGLKELHWNIQRKKVEKMISAASSLIKVKSDEAHNLIWSSPSALFVSE